MRYHNVKLLPVQCSVECLFARFAYTVFSPLLAAFFVGCQTTSRRVHVYDASTGTFSIETRNREQAKALYAASQSRSVSLRKRSQPGEGDDNDPGDHDLSSSVSDGGWDQNPDGSQPDSGFGERQTPSRGRSRKRPWEVDADCRDAAGKEGAYDALKRAKVALLTDYAVGTEAESHQDDTTEDQKF